MRYLFLVVFLAFKICHLYAEDCYVKLESDTLYIGNSLIERKFIWNKGNLMTHSITDKQNRQVWKCAKPSPDFWLPKQSQESMNPQWTTKTIEATAIVPGHTEVTITYIVDKLDIKRVYRIYPGCPAIACDTYLKGEAAVVWRTERTNAADLKNVESLNTLSHKNEIPVLDQISLPGRHWHISAVEFFDVTDRNNTLVRPYEALSYHENTYRGNLLFFENMEIGKGLFFLKEAPCSGVQLAYPGSDFIVGGGQVKTIGTGVETSDLKPGEWTRAYGIVTGVYAGNELNRLSALRAYQKNIRSLVPGRDEMLMMNTWGDRGQDKKVNEAFCLKELESAARLGITHFQIDDGWQAGKSANSAFGGSFKNIWSNPDYWKPDPAKYPNGLTPVVQKGKELGIEVCLWFNPSFQNDYEDWQKDADAMAWLYKTYGIRTFKIDGLSIPNKLSETRVRQIFDKVLAETDNQAVFNLDATAGRRGGYFFFNEYGNVFLENRYTDWHNYYPFWTLRNLWMLTKYVPAEKLQIEFLNKWRNQQIYQGEPFAPSVYSFDYLFAITMAAQPLAWMEGTGLPEEAFATKGLIDKYKTIQHEFHQGVILPIGDEPSGTSWTGFQSVGEKGGFLIVFREKNPNSTCELDVYVDPGLTIECTPLIGAGKKIKQRVTASGIITVGLPAENSFAVYRYQIK